MADRHAIRRLVKRHQETLRQFGEVVSDDDRKPQGGRPSRAFHLNKRQCIYITAKSDTPRAAEITVQMVEVFDAYTAGRKPIAVKAHTRASAVGLPAPASDGLAVMRIDGRSVAVDTNTYDVTERDEAVVAYQDGRIAVARVSTRDGQTWASAGKRCAMTQTRAPTEKERGQVIWTGCRECVTVIGLVVAGAERRKLLAAA